MSKHTPGPWVTIPHRGSAVHDRVTSWLLHVKEDIDGLSADDTWGEIYGSAHDDDAEMEATARLIASAPDLLEALKGMTEHYAALVNSGDCGSWDPETEAEVIAARAAIAKAESGT